MIRTAKYFLLVFIISYWSSECLLAQNTLKTNILFVLDASGSMNDVWKNEKKIVTAKKIINQMVDSIRLENRGKPLSKQIDIGLRVFGHQQPRSAKDCNDTKLEVPINNSSYDDISEALGKVTAQGYTPIAYSLGLSTSDFTLKSDVNNVIILVTDGTENCEGNPCEISAKLQRNGIIIRPFIIGLGLNVSQKKLFDCVGTVYDVQDEKQATIITQVVISNVLNPTSLQVNLIDAYGNPTETNVNMTFYEGPSRIRANIYHTMTNSGTPDTFYMPPFNNYSIKVHTLPSVTKANISVLPGRKNIAAVETPQGELAIKMYGSMKYKGLRSLIQVKNSNSLLNVQPINVTQKYLINEYDVALLTLPIEYFDETTITQSQTNEIKVPSPGTLNYYTNELAYAAIFKEDNGYLTKIYNLPSDSKKDAILLQPGTYTVIFRPKNALTSYSSIQKDFTIYTNKVTTIKF
ncbi:MAG: Ca-activated chloride channel family protein [Sphingobacteriales bacterium]|jgi:Ca-activated chloride channel family protein